MKQLQEPSFGQHKDLSEQPDDAWAGVNSMATFSL